MDGIGWGGGSGDAFYKEGEYVEGEDRKWHPLKTEDEEYRYIMSGGDPIDPNFDKIISGEYGVKGLYMNCGGLQWFSRDKLGTKPKTRDFQYPEFRFSNVKPGDILSFGVDKHTATVGEVYNNRIVIYDFGVYIGSRNYKINVNYSQGSSSETDLSILRGIYGGDIASSCGIQRQYNYINE